MNRYINIDVTKMSQVEVDILLCEMQVTVAQVAEKFLNDTGELIYPVSAIHSLRARIEAVSKTNA